MKRRKAKRSRSQLLALRSEPTPERMRHAGADWDVGDDKQGTVRITLRDAPLERLHFNGVIDFEQYTAGYTFRRHWYQGGLDGLASQGLLRVGHGAVNFDHLSKTEAQEYHRKQFFMAVRYVGAVNGRVLSMVLCYEIPLHIVGASLGWATPNQGRAAATERVKDGLDRLHELWA